MNEINAVNQGPQTVKRAGSGRKIRHKCEKSDSRLASGESRKHQGRYVSYSIVLRWLSRNTFGPR